MSYNESKIVNIRCDYDGCDLAFEGKIEGNNEDVESVVFEKLEDVGWFIGKYDDSIHLCPEHHNPSDYRMVVQKHLTIDNAKKLMQENPYRSAPTEIQRNEELRKSVLVSVRETIDEASSILDDLVENDKDPKSHIEEIEKIFGLLVEAMGKYKKVDIKMGLDDLLDGMIFG